MKLVSSPLSLAFASAALILAGCSKKPDRPTPLQTAPMGNSSLTPSAVDTTLDPNSGLAGFAIQNNQHVFYMSNN